MIGVEISLCHASSVDASVEWWKAPSSTLTEKPPSTFMTPGERVCQDFLDIRSLSSSCTMDPYSTYLCQLTIYGRLIIHYPTNALHRSDSYLVWSIWWNRKWSCCRYKSGQNHLTEFIGVEPSKKRKRRTSFTPQALELLNAHFERNTHPSGKDAYRYNSGVIGYRILRPHWVSY